MTSSALEFNATGFQMGMRKGCSAYAETALAMRLIPASAPQQAAAEAERLLAKREMLLLPDDAFDVVCLAGELWLTRDGDIEDYILGPGDQLSVKRGDKAALQALQPSRVKLLAA